MAITTQLVGTIGGAPEKQTVRVDTGSSTTIINRNIPSGWSKAVGIFVGTGGNRSEYTVFSMLVRPSGDNVDFFNKAVTGGAEVVAGQTVDFRYVKGTVTWYKLA